MAGGAGGGEMLTTAAVYLGAAVVAAPLFKRLNLGSVLGYIAAGVAVGPYAFGLAAGGAEAQAVGEFGVVLLLFVIGLELKPSRLWRLCYEIFGLGAAQVLVSAAAIGLLAYFVGLWGFSLDWREATVAGAGFALSSTAFAVQILRERGALATPYGDRSFAILLFQDLAIVPLIALVAVLSPPTAASDVVDPVWWVLMQYLAAIGAVYFVGRYALKPLFHVLAQTKSDETFTAAALLVVVASALVMDMVGLSMAMGAFLAGVLLAETEFRHQLETDIEPFRGLLMGLFFMSVGMGLALDLVGQYLASILLGVAALVALKAAILFALARAAGSSKADALKICAVLSQGGEFGFVLFTQAASTGLLGGADASLLNATVILSMATTPFVMMAAERVAARLDAADDPEPPTIEQVAQALGGPPRSAVSADAFDAFHGRNAVEAGSEPPDARRIIVAGFGRFGQVVARILRLRGYPVTLIDSSPRRIRMAESFGNRVYFGDARRIDTLAAAGADEARAIFLCIDDRDGARQAVEKIRARFPAVRIFASTYDRFSLLEMEKAGAHVVERETFESAIKLARRALEEFGDAEIIDDLIEEFHRRDQQLMKLQAEFGAEEGLRKLREGFSLEKEG